MSFPQIRGASMSRRPRHVSEIIREHLEGVGLEPGQVHHVEVRHAEHCPFWDGHDCDCEPEVESGARVERKYGGDT